MKTLIIIVGAVIVVLVSLYFFFSFISGMIEEMLKEKLENFETKINEILENKRKDIIEIHKAMEYLKNNFKTINTKQQDLESYLLRTTQYLRNELTKTIAILQRKEKREKKWY